ncbi:MAG TPA: hypothetical protein VGC76_15865 [Pyrinomonadaceae bacterium]|jgi:hypothetical protein
MANNSQLALLEKQYAFLDKNFEKIFNKAPTDDEKIQFRQDYTTARDNYYEALNRTFNDNDSFVKSLTKELKDTQTQIEQMTASFQNIVLLLDTITAGVRLASSLIVLGSSIV